MSDDVIACDLEPPTKNPGYAYVTHCSTLIMINKTTFNQARINLCPLVLQ